ILAILSTVAFISFQGYAQSSRDAVRIADVKSITKVLELYSLKNSNYPEPVNPINITYSGSLAWTQGDFGKTAYTDSTSIGGEAPTDPLTGLPYLYSVTNTKTEYQVAGILEGLLSYSPVSSTYAGDELAKAYVKGNYNGKMIKINGTTQDYILGVPSILTSDITSVDIIDILAADSLIYNGYSNLSPSYSGSVFKSDGGFGFTPTEAEVVVFSGSLSDLGSEENDLLRAELITNLQEVYVGSEVANTPELQDIVHVDISSPEQVDYVSSSIVNNTLGAKLELPPKVEISGGNTGGGTGSAPSPYGNPDLFVSTWDLSIDTGISGFNNIQLPLHDSGTYNFTVDWGDGTTDVITSWNQSETLHSYAEGGTYQITIDGDINEFGFDSPNMGSSDDQHDGDKLIDINQWGNMLLLSSGDQFSSCENITVFSADDLPDISHVTSMSGMFRFASNFNHDIGDWDTSNVTDMSGMFRGANAFNQSLNNWDVSHVTDMNYMFMTAVAFNQPLNNWDVSNVTSMTMMFNFASIFNQNISSWDTGNVTNMQSMFYNAVAFNQPLNNWDVSEVTHMGGMFKCTIFNQPLDSWDVSSVTNMGEMFNWNGTACWSTPDVLFNQNINHWDVDNVTNCYLFASNKTDYWIANKKPNFTNCIPERYTPVDASGPNISNLTPSTPITSGLSAIQVTLDTHENGICRYSQTARTDYDSMTGIFDISGGLSHEAIIQNLVDGQKYDFYIRCIDELGNKNTSDTVVTVAVDLSANPYGGSEIFVSTWDVDISAGKTGVSVLQLPLNSSGSYDFTVDWGDGTTSHITDVTNEANYTHNYDTTGGSVFEVTMQGDLGEISFAYQKTKTELDPGEFIYLGKSESSKLLNVKQWGTIKIGNTGSQFSSTVNLTNLSFHDAPDLSGVTNAISMFRSARLLKNGVKHWDVSHITNMQEMFYNADQFNGALNQWDVSQVTDMALMFRCSRMSQPLHSWNVGEVTNMEHMFGVTAVCSYGHADYNQNINNWNTDKVTHCYHYDGGQSGWNPSYKPTFGVSCN
ncbi:MAG: BspA family leucine-rich repeat surface protein, partial [Candidatus Gracilibacteria bacterium]|nr:BspA family leucine-rich repeat surface protein [Candidatus Gracilibacteria bacterium]